MLQCGNWEPVRSYFKFENWWLQANGFKDRIKGWWESFTCEGRPDFILAFKLNALKEKLKRMEQNHPRKPGITKSKYSQSTCRIGRVTNFLINGI